MFKVLSASPAAYSANPKAKLSNPPALSGSDMSLVSVMQVAICHMTHCLFHISVSFLLYRLSSVAKFYMSRSCLLKEKK